MTEKTYVKVGDISATELLKSPRQRLLSIRHDKEIVKDAMENLWSVMGTAVHDLMARHANVKNKEVAERRFSIKVKGPIKEWELTGEADLIEDIGGGVLALTDYKFVGVYSYLLEKKRGGVKEDWEKQVNIYRYIVKKSVGWDIKLLRIAMIFRDWTQSKTTDPDYPPQILILDAPVWPFDKIEKFIADRVKVHQSAELLTDDKLPDCTPEEKWERGETWAVMKGTNKRAEKLCGSAKEAEAFAKEIPNSSIVHRPGKPMKCLNYCDGAPWCNTFKAYQNASV